MIRSPLAENLLSLNGLRRTVLFIALSAAVGLFATTSSAEDDEVVVVMPEYQGPSLSEDMHHSMSQAYQAQMGEELERKKAKSKAEQEAAARAALMPDRKREQAELQMLVSSGFVPLMLYGSAQYDILLGCLNCAPNLSISIWNQKGPYGSLESGLSIWSQAFEFGNPSSRQCPWNRYAGSPPAVVDSKGKFYGFLTHNPVIKEQFKSTLTEVLFEHVESIRPAPQKWFESIFEQEIEGNKLGITLEQMNKMTPPSFDNEDDLERLSEEERQKRIEEENRNLLNGSSHYDDFAS